MDRVTAAYKKETSPDEPEVDTEVDPNVPGSAVVVDEAQNAANLSMAEQLLMNATEEERRSDRFLRIQSGVRIAERKIQQQLSWVVDSDDEGKLAQDLKGCLASQARGDPDSKQWVAIVLDAKTLCESGSQGKYRLPPTRTPQLKRLLNAFLATRDEGDLADGDCLVVFDGGKGSGPDWVEKNVTKILPAKRCAILGHYVVYTHDSVEQRNPCMKLKSMPFEPMKPKRTLVCNCNLQECTTIVLSHSSSALCAGCHVPASVLST